MITDLLPYLAAAASANSGATTLVANVGSNNGTTTGTGTGWPVLPGDLIIVCGGVGSAVPTGISDSQGNTYTSVTSVNVFAATWMYTATAGTHGLRSDTPDTVTATYAGTGQVKSFVVMGCPAMAATPLDGTAVTATGTSAAPSVTSGALAGVGNGGNGELIVAMMTNAPGNGAPTWAAGWTQIGQTRFTGSSYVSVAVANKTGTSAVTASATFGTSGNWSMIIAAFKPAVVSQKDLVGASIFHSTYNSGSRLENGALFDGYANAGSTKPRAWSTAAQKIYFNENQWPSSGTMYDFDALSDAGVFQYVTFRCERHVGGGTTASLNSLIAAVTLYKNYQAQQGDTARWVIFPWNEAGGHGEHGDFGDGTMPSKGITQPSPYGSASNPVTAAQAAANYITFHQYYMGPMAGNQGLAGCGVPVGYNGQSFSPAAVITYFPGRQYVSCYAPDYYASDYYKASTNTTLAPWLAQAAGTSSGYIFSPPLPVGIPEMGVSEGGAVTTAQFDTWMNQQLIAPLQTWIQGGGFIAPTVWFDLGQGGDVVDGSTPTLELTDLQLWWDSFTPPAGGALTITTTSLPSGTQGTAYAGATLAATGGTSPYTWVATGLPAGLACSSGGVISGTPTASGSFSVQVTVTDSASNTAVATFGLSVAVGSGAPQITTSSLPGATQGMAYGTVLNATGGTTPYAWSVPGGGLPAGITLNGGSGGLTGTPSIPGAYTFTVVLTDAASLTAHATFTLTVSSTLAINPMSAPTAGTVGISYGSTFAATGGVPPYSWSVPANSIALGGSNALPPGLSLDPFGNLTGIPSLAGNYTFTVQVTDNTNAIIQGTFQIAIAAAPASEFDSLIIADQIELLGGSVPSTNPACNGAIFRLQPGYDLGEPQPTTDIVASLILDGERPYGYRASNRTITLPLMIEAPDFDTLAGALEVLLDAVDAQTWTLTWTRKGNTLPLLLDCFRAQPSAVQYGGVDQMNINPVAVLQLTFAALPYGRSDEPLQIAVASPLPGQSGQANPVVIDNFSAVTGANWVQSTRHVYGPDSAKWDPCLPPLNDCTGRGSQPGAYYTAVLASPVSILGLTALTVQAGFGSDYYTTWHKGPALFVFTLTDGDGTQISFSRSMEVHASNDSTQPKWQQVTAQIPQGEEGFDYTTVSAYSVTVTNRKVNTLRYVKLYLDALTANPPSVQAPAPVRGAMYSILGVAGTARTTCSAQFQQAPGTASPVTVTLPGPAGVPLTWTVPAGVTTLTKIECTGASGAAGSQPKGSNNNCAGGSGGGEYAAEASVAVTALSKLTYTIGDGGDFVAGGAGLAGTASTITAGSVTVTAHGGQGGAGGSNGAGGAGGTGSTNTTHFNGGSGSAGVNNTHTGAGGGSAGSSGAGGNASGATGGTAGTGTTAGVAGANGLTKNGDGIDGTAPGGGAAGAWTGSDAENGGDGADGQIKITYTPTIATFSTLIAHRPGPQAPQDLSPIVTFGDSDTPNGTIEYPLQTLIPGTNADFLGTYSVVVVADVWDSPSTSRTVTITVKQYEFQGGPSYSTSVSRTFKPSTDISNGIVILGELTLPLKDVAPDNLAGLYTITITDTDTSDTFLDCLFLDTLGQTCLVNIPTSGAYLNFFLDEPDVDVDIGRVMGSVFDRSAAISVLDNAMVSGGPLYLVPGDNLLLCYAVEGAPSLAITYFPKFWLDRTS